MLAESSGEGGIDPGDLEAFVTRILTASGTPEENAVEVAESLTLADVRGHNSHGTRQVPRYVELTKGERDDVYTLDPEVRPEIAAEGPVHAVVDGRFGHGHVIAREGVNVAVEKARENGLAMVGLRDATHIGRIGEWGERAADAGLLFSAYVYNHSQLAAPPGSAQRRYGTNPICHAIPTFDALDFDVVLDVATTQVAAGKIGEAATKGQPLPGAWTVTEDASPLSTGEAFRDGEGAILPIGGLDSGYKGFGLAMVAELFGSIAGDTVVHGQQEFNRGNAAMFVAADPTLFTSREAIEDRVLALRDYIAETEFEEHVPTGPVAYGDEALLPGEPEHRVAKDRRENGVPLPDGDVEALCELAADLGLTDVPPAFENVASADD